TFAKNTQDIQNLPPTVPRFPAPGSFGAAFGRNFISPGGRTTWIWGNVPLDSAGRPLPIGTVVTAGCSAGVSGCKLFRIADTVTGVPSTYRVVLGADTLDLPYTQGSYRYRAWGGGKDVRAYLESATNVTLRDLSLSYDAPEQWTSRLGARSLRITFQARNLFK